MRVSAPSVSQRRLHRYHRWMLLWLVWFAAFLKEARAFAPFSNQATEAAHQWLDRIERFLVDLVVMRAAPRVRGCAPPRHAARRRLASQLRRAVIGSALRRALRPDDLGQRISALSQDIEGLVRRILKRLPRGLTRRRPHLARRQPRQVVSATAGAQSVVAADTS